jgi:hypothetical protein
VAVAQVYKATGTRAHAVTCVSKKTMRELDGHGSSDGYATFGLTNMDTRHIYLDRQEVCAPISRYLRTGYLSNWAVLAIMAVGHEARPSHQPPPPAPHLPSTPSMSRRWSATSLEIRARDGLCPGPVPLIQFRNLAICRYTARNIGRLRVYD